MTKKTNKFNNNNSNTCGGKAAGLALLNKMKMPVPQWIALNWSQASNISDKLLDKIIEYFGSDNLVAVRSSADNEDGTQKSFAGMFESKLNVPTTKNDLRNAISSVIASGTSLRVNEYDGGNNNMGIVIQKMIKPIISGVAFTDAIDTDGSDVVLIEATYGLGDKLVSGLVTPTQIKVPIHDDILDQDNIFISGKLLPGIDLINNLIKQIQILRNKSKTKLDTEWCIDSDNNVWFVQARPITQSVFIKNRTTSSAIPVVGGTVTAPVYVIPELGAHTSPEIMKKRFTEFPEGAILVALYTEVDFIPIMKRASGIITEQGGVLSHAAILSRELGIPCIVNYPNATKKFKNGDIITMNATTGQIKEDAEFMHANETAWMDEAWMFDNMKRVPYNGGCVFVEQLPNRLNVYAPWMETKDVSELDLFIRKKFGIAPNIIRGDSQYSMKFFSWFEDRNHKKLPGYSAALNKAYNVAKSMSAIQVHNFYNQCINTAKKYISLAQNAQNAATKLYFSETVIAQYILLDVIFPRAIALYQLYYETAQKLHLAGATFADLLALKKIKGIPKKYYDFIIALSQERNDIYPKFQELFPEIIGYWIPDNATTMQRAALNAIGIKNTNNMFMLNEFYKNLSKVKKIV